MNTHAAISLILQFSGFLLDDDVSYESSRFDFERIPGESHVMGHDRVYY